MREMKKGDKWTSMFMIPVEIVTEYSAGFQSKAKARRLIEQGGFKIDGKAITSWGTRVELDDGMVIQIGKKEIFKVKMKWEVECIEDGEGES